MLHFDRVSNPCIPAVITEGDDDALPVALMASVLLEVDIVDDLPGGTAASSPPIGGDCPKGLTGDVAVPGVEARPSRLLGTAAA